MATVEIDSRARQELALAYDYVDAEKEGAGDRLFAEWTRGIAEIAATPQQFPSVTERVGSREVRFYRLPTFSYRIVYLVQADKLVVIAFSHLRRQTGYWRNRLRDN